MKMITNIRTNCSGVYLKGTGVIGDIGYIGLNIFVAKAYDHVVSLR